MCVITVRMTYKYHKWHHFLLFPAIFKHTKAY